MFDDRLKVAAAVKVQRVVRPIRLALFVKSLRSPMATYAQLKKQMQQLAKQAEAAFKAEKDAVLAKVRDAVGSFGLTVEEVFGVGIKKKGKSSKPARSKRVPNGAGQAKYADPKTGATWSGFGRAPAWIASAKDRTKFLVAQPVEVTAPDKPKVAKSAAKKAPATKKAAKATASVTPAKKAARAVNAAPAKKTSKTTAKAKAAAPVKKTAPLAPKKAVKATAPAKKTTPSKAKAKVSAQPAKTPVAEPAAVAQG